MITVINNEMNPQVASLLESVKELLQTPKPELVEEVERYMSIILGMDVSEAFAAVARVQQHTAPSLNLDRAHKSALVLLAHILAQVAQNTTHQTSPPM